MVCTRVALLERRPDLPLCSLRRMRHLRVGKNAARTCSVRDHLTPKSTCRVERDVYSLLQTPVTNSDGLSRRDQIAIGKAIVGRPGKDDHWVTSSTAGWTFAAATAEFPENILRPVSFNRLREVSKRICRTASPPACQELDGPNRRAQSRQRGAGSCPELIGSRDLAMLESRYRLAAAECRADTAGALSSDCAADRAANRRHRRTRKRDDSPEATPSARFESNRRDVHDDGMAATTGSLERGRKVGITSSPQMWAEDDQHQPKSHHPIDRGSGDDDRLTLITSRPQALIGDGRSSPLRRSPSGHRGTPRHTVTRTILHTTSDLSHEFRHSGVRGDGPDEVHAFFGQVASRGQDTDAFRVARMTPQSRLADSREGEAGRSLMRNRWIPLHRGLVITDGVRAELLNPMSHRFKLLRGAH